MRALRGLLLAFLVLASSVSVLPSAQAQEPAWKIDDPAGDVVGSASTTPTALTNHIDVRQVTIDREDETAIDVTIKVEGFRVEPKPDPNAGFAFSCGGGSSSSGGGSSFRMNFRIEFVLAESPIRYTAFVRILGQGGPNGFVANSAMGLLCIHTATPGAGNIWQPIAVTLEANMVHVSLTKAALMGQLPPPEFPSTSPRATRPPALVLGHRLSDFVIVSTGGADSGICCFMPEPLSDVAPNAGKGPVYVLREHAANTVLRIESAAGARHLSVAPGNQSAPLRITNNADAKRLVRLQYDVVGPDASRVQLSGPAAITVAAKESKNFSAAVEVTGATPLDPATRVKVRGISTGYADEIGSLSVPLMFGAVLAPGANIVYLHGSKDLDGLLPQAGETCQVFLLGSCRRAMLSTLETDPAANTPDEISIRLGPATGGVVARGYMDGISTQVPTAAPFAVAAGQPVQLDLKFASSQPADLQVRAVLSHAAEPTRFVREETAFADATSTGSTGSPMKISMTVPSTETFVVPRGQYLRLRLEIAIAAGAGGAAAPLTGLRLIGKESRITLPLTDVPDGLLGPALQGTFQLRATEDGQEFVNPGEARMINVTVLNQAPDNRTARLSLQAGLPDWKTELLPGNAFTLLPGDSIIVAVRVHAPPGAKEGERANVWLNATDEAGKPSTLRLALISTSGVDLPNDAGPYEGDSEAKAKLQAATPEDTPSLGLVAAALAVAGVLLARRRRQV